MSVVSVTGWWCRFMESRTKIRLV